MLDALQYLSNLCLARKSEGEHKEYVRVIIDIENYREKREATLRALARRMAGKALKYQRNVLLEPMNPYERMIIHSEVQGIEGVSTHSVGYDENRKIVITVDKKKK
jgi:spoIIIJ-associated protein